MHRVFQPKAYKKKIKAWQRKCIRVHNKLIMYKDMATYYLGGWGWGGGGGVGCARGIVSGTLQTIQLSATLQ